MAWVFVPGYGIWPRRAVRPLSKARIIGQASMDFLGRLSGKPSFTVEDTRPPVRFPDLSPAGIEAHRRLATAFKVDPSQRHGFDALLELVEEDERAFRSPTPAQAQDQAEKMAESVRELARHGIASGVDWLSFTSPEVRDGLPIVVVGVRGHVVAGMSSTGVPLVRMRGELLPVAPSKIHGRAVEFKISTDVPLNARATEIAPINSVDNMADDDSPVVADNWTRTRGGWLDYSGPEVTPGGADGMGSIMKIHTDVGGMTLKPLLISRLSANNGVYVRSPDNSWSFVLDPLLRIRLLLKGVKAPVSVSADKLVCWNTVPSLPLIGGFVHPETGFHCRSASIPVEWDTAIHGTPGIRLTGYDTLGDAPTPPTPLARAEDLARRINEDLGALAGKAPKWWIYTSPVVKDGKPLVRLGVKGDYQPDAKELKALPWEKWTALGVELNVEFVPPVGSGVKGTVAKITPDGLAEVGMADDLAAAPVDTVWPTSSPDWREPTGPATGDNDPAMGQDGEEAGMSKSNWAGSGVTLADLAQVSHGFPARWLMPSKYLHPPALGDTDEGMGSAPIMAMPTGMLNWDRVTGYEGQPWVTKDWSGKGFMDGIRRIEEGAEVVELDDCGLGDLGQSGSGRKEQRRPLVLGAASATLGAVAGWVMAPGGDARKGAVAGGVVGGIAGLIVGKLLGGAEGMISSVASARTAASPGTT